MYTYNALRGALAWLTSAELGLSGSEAAALYPAM